MYARKYYLIIYRRSLLLIYRRNLLPEYSRTSQQQYSRASQQPIVFLCKVTFDLLTFLPFATYTIFIKFTPFTIHLVHLFTFTSFTFSLSPFHLFLSSFSPFPLLSPPPSIPLYLTTSGTKTEKKPGQLFRFSQKCINFAAIKKQI